MSEFGQQYTQLYFVYYRQKKCFLPAVYKQFNRFQSDSPHILYSPLSVSTDPLNDSLSLRLMIHGITF